MRVISRDDGVDGQDFEALSRRRRRILVLLAIARLMVTSVGLVVAYYLLPMDRPMSADTVAALVFGLVLVSGLLVWQTISITKSPYPRLRAIEAVTAVFSLFIMLFATTYFLMARSTADVFTQALNRTDSLYFTITTFATVGFGDIAPLTQGARITVLVQVLADLLLLGVALKVILGVTQATLGRGDPAVFPPSRSQQGTPPDQSGESPTNNPQ
ncbi:potassium channel family protein [Streptomyces sp. NPDC059752]|uniref:potassium channel family protein n=1 Tax=unclassified Streptomyces TaxID=2593676 RepID=UPI0036586174